MLSVIYRDGRGGDLRLDVVEFLQMADAIGFDPAVALKNLRRIKE